MNTQRDTRKNVLILAFTLVVIMLGFGMVMPIFPFYIDALGASGVHLGLLMASYSLMQLFCAPIWGSVSDRIGRKPVLLLGILGNALSLALYGLSTELWMLFAARILSGVLSSATLPTTMAYVSDSTSDDDRGGGMGQLGGAMGLGVILGPGLGGWLATDSLSTPFFVAAGLSLVSLALVWALLPESLPAAARQAGEKMQTVQIGKLWRALWSPIGVLLILAFLASLGLTNFEAIFGLYALQKFAYGPERVGTILTVVGIVSAVMQGLCTGPLTRRWGEARVIQVCMAASAGAFLLLLTARSYAGVLATTGFFILCKTLIRPALTSLMSKRTTIGHGAIQGLNNSFMSLGRIVGPLWAGFAFDMNVDYPYLSGAAMMLIGFAVSARWISQGARRVRRSGEAFSQESERTQM